MCLCIGVLLAMPGTAWGISGFASGGTAVGAQYPDSAAAQSGSPKPEITDLAEVTSATRSSRLSDPDAWQALVPRELQAASTGAAAASLSRTGSIALLVAAIGVLLVGGVLRWQRGDARAE